MSFLNKKIISFEPEMFGLDLNDLSIKVLQLKRDGGKDEILGFSVMEVPEGLIDDGKIINKEKVASLIREAWKKSGPKKIKTNKVICSLPESKAFLRIITIPKMGESEAHEAIKWEMEASIPMPIDQVYFDWQFFGSDGKGKQNVLTVAVSREIVDDLMEVLEKAGLDAYGLEVESIANVRSLISGKDSERTGTSLVVDLGAQRTGFIMVVKGVPYFTSSIPLSSVSIDDAIEKKLNLSHKEAEEAKIVHGIERFHGDNPVFWAIQPLLENLVNEIKKTLDFYASVAREKTDLEKIILCGGGANLKGLVAYLTQRLEKEVVLGDPWVNINLGKELPIIDKENSVRYATVIGLALHGLEYED